MNMSPRPDTILDRSPETLLPLLYQAAVEAVEPARALARALETDPTPPSQHLWIAAIGKAAPAMARAAAWFADARSLPLAGGVIVSPEGGASPHTKISHLRAEHPEPGPGSEEAAQALDRLIRMVQPGDAVWVLLSGGTTSLVAAPVKKGITAADLRTLYHLVLRAGLDIGTMNAVRKRVAKWGAGRLARALSAAGATTRCYVMSDVIDNDLAAIGSGPCVPDRTTISDVVDILTSADLWNEVPMSIRGYLDAVAAGTEPETPKDTDPAFAGVTHRIIATNADAVTAAAVRARALGLDVVTVAEPMEGDAAAAAIRFVDRLEHVAFQRPAHGHRSAPHCVIQGGETTVTVASGAAGLGGRCQEFALAAARRLDQGDGSGASWWLLAAGTDGRDGPTDAAGAIVHAGTWGAIRRRGRDPLRDLEGHDAYHALDAVGALFKPGPTGTNVMDIVVALEGVGS